MKYDRLPKKQLIEEIERLREAAVPQHPPALNSESKYKTLFELANDAIVVADAETGVIIEANRMAEELFGRPAASLIGMHHSRLHPELIREQALKGFQMDRESISAISHEMLIEHSSGRHIAVRISARRIDLDGRAVLMGLFQDDTERSQSIASLKESMRKLQQQGVPQTGQNTIRNRSSALRADLMSQVVRGISNDLNNLLSLILGNVELVRMSTGSAQERSMLERAMTAVEQAHAQIAHLTSIASEDPVHTQGVDIERIARQTIELYESIEQTGGRLSLDVMSGLWRVSGSPVHLQQALMSLAQYLRGIIEHVSDKDMANSAGVLRLDNFTIEGEGPQSEEQDFVRIRAQFLRELRGVTPDVFSHEYTTLRASLPESKSCTLRHEPGGELTLLIPRSDRVEKKRKEALALSSGSEGILIVDDERDLCNSTADMLSSLGYSVYRAYSPEEALSLFHRHRETIALCIIDIVMPGMYGTDLLRRFRSEVPRLKCILTTGNPERFEDSQMQEGELLGFLSKPFLFKTLAESVRTLLGHDAGVREVRQDVNRLKLSLISEESVPYRDEKITVEAAYELFRHLAQEPREKTIALYLDKEHHLIGYEEIGQGASDAGVLHPQEVLKTALLSNASGIMLVHNHPSGDSMPSQHDIELTLSMIEACKRFNIILIDHVIIGRDTFFAFRPDDIHPGLDD